jgi:hypothetical protein
LIDEQYEQHGFDPEMIRSASISLTFGYTGKRRIDTTVWYLWHSQATTLQHYAAIKRKRPVGFPAGLYNPGDDLLSPVRTTIGRTSLASVFGMGTGVSPYV